LVRPDERLGGIAAPEQVGDVDEVLLGADPDVILLALVQEIQVQPEGSQLIVRLRQREAAAGFKLQAVGFEQRP